MYEVWFILFNSPESERELSDQAVSPDVRVKMNSEILFQLHEATTSSIWKLSPLEMFLLPPKRASYVSIKDRVMSFFPSRGPFIKLCEHAPFAFIETFIMKTPSSLQPWKNSIQKVIYMLTFTALLPIKYNFPGLNWKVVMILYFWLVHDENSLCSCHMHTLLFMGLYINVGLQSVS